PVAVALDQLIAPLLEVEYGEQLARAFLDVRATLAEQAGDEAQELGAGQLLVDEWPVRNESEDRLGGDGVGDDVDAGNAHRARGRAEDARDHAQRRGFAGAVRAEEPEELTARHDEVDVIDGGEGTVFLREGGEFDHLKRRPGQLR